MEGIPAGSYETHSVTWRRAASVPLAKSVVSREGHYEELLMTSKSMHLRVKNEIQELHREANREMIKKGPHEKDTTLHPCFPNLVKVYPNALGILGNVFPQT